MPLDQQIVQVGSGLAGKLLEGEIIDDEKVGSDPRAQLTLEGVVGARAGQMCQQLIGPAEQHSVTGPASRMPESLCEKRLADANGTAKK